MGGGISVDVKQQPEPENLHKINEQKFNKDYREKTAQLFNIHEYVIAKDIFYSRTFNDIDFLLLQEALIKEEEMINSGEKERLVQELNILQEEIKLLPHCGYNHNLRILNSMIYCDKLLPELFSISTWSRNLPTVVQHKREIVHYIKKYIHPKLKEEFFCPLSSEEIDTVTDIKEVVVLYDQYMERKRKFKIWLCEQLDEFSG